jgi:hypothetical protein
MSKGDAKNSALISILFDFGLASSGAYGKSYAAVNSRDSFHGVVNSFQVIEI